MPELDRNRTDTLVSLAKSVFGTCPIIGSIASETLAVLIPEQRSDRIVTFIKKLDEKVSTLNTQVDIIQSNIENPEGLDIFEEGMIQSTRAVSKSRIEELASIIANSLSQERLKYAEARKLLNIFRELTDPEILWLLYYSEDPFSQSEFHKRLQHENPDVLELVIEETGMSQEEIDKGAIQDSYRETLARLDLLEYNGPSFRITPLGDLLIRYIDARKSNSEES